MKEKKFDSGKYIRVGTTLYKIVQRPLISGDCIEEKIPWSYETLRQDYGKNDLPEIDKYDGFCIIPDHVNYKQVHGTYLKPIRTAKLYAMHRESFLISETF